jgi:hypothetical protein
VRVLVKTWANIFVAKTDAAFRMKFPGAALLLIALLFRMSLLPAQTIPAADDSAHSLLRGLLPSPTAVSLTKASVACVRLPVDEESREIQGPHGGSLITSSCRVDSLSPVDSLRQPHWMTAHYHWISVYSAEDSSRGAGARDTLAEEEVVLFRSPSSGSLIPVWHQRFETGDYAIWRSVTPELARARGGTLLSVMQCVNGTGGCSQEFLLRHPDGRWFPVWQEWLDQLPRGFKARILHGARIDPRTLRGEAGLYGGRDPNCCPSQNLIVYLTVRGDSLVLLRHSVRPALKE